MEELNFKYKELKQTSNNLSPGLGPHPAGPGEAGKPDTDAFMRCSKRKK